MKNKIAFVLMRVGLGVVFLLFGIGKFRNDIWAETIKNMDFFLKLPWDVNLSVFFIGLLETLTGIALIVGLFTRFFSGLACAQLMGILILLGFQETRDFGLLGAAIYLATVKSDFLSIDWFLAKQKGSK
jgi:uncharacterized membrane protein YphA (DoxX/SURF4 family)